MPSDAIVVCILEEQDSAPPIARPPSAGCIRANEVPGEDIVVSTIPDNYSVSGIRRYDIPLHPAVAAYQVVMRSVGQQDAITIGIWRCAITEQADIIVRDDIAESLGTIQRNCGSRGVIDSAANDHIAASAGRSSYHIAVRFDEYSMPAGSLHLQSFDTYLRGCYAKRTGQERIVGTINDR